ncbi:MAG: CheR family methyltransferase [Salinisphaeraceae bacterium]|nr:CheR family methyltransferase [Salinisphaeraceae bacterium]
MTQVINAEFAFSSEDFERIRKLIHSRAGISLADSKETLVYGRLSRRIRKLGMQSFGQYLESLDAAPNSPEWVEFTNALTTNLTAFFREAHHFETLAQLMRAQPAGKQRLWSAACSTGEEAYSLAITACEVFDSLTPPVEIIATDLDTQVLAKASAGIYDIERIAGLSEQRKKLFFDKGNGPHQGKCRVKAPLRKLVRFEPLNLLAHQWPIRGEFLAIFCRNVMIYFDKDTQYRILSRLVRHLPQHGLLFAGHSESFFHAADIVTSCGKTVYRPTAHVKEAS